MSSPTGRDHNHWGFTVWLAGGGVKGGQAVPGATDEFGYKAVENPVHVHDLHATILKLLGFDHEKSHLSLRRPRLPPRPTSTGRVVKEVIGLRHKPLHGDAGVHNDVDDCGRCRP